METNIDLNKESATLNILLVGNNPIEMGVTLEKINQIRERKIITEIAFDVKSIISRLLNFTPNFILIDDNIGKPELNETIHQLSKTPKTKDIPITVLKNSNYHEASPSAGFMDYLLKHNLSADSLYKSLGNSLRLKRTQLYLYKAYRKRQDQLKKLL